MIERSELGVGYVTRQDELPGLHAQARGALVQRGHLLRRQPTRDYELVAGANALGEQTVRLNQSLQVLAKLKATDIEDEAGPDVREPSAQMSPRRIG